MLVLGFAAAMAAWAVGPLLAQGASGARVECEFSPATRVLSVALTGTPARPAKAELRRDGAGIEVSDPRRSVACGVAPTVTETERIEISTEGTAEIEIDLSGGALAPGFGAEADGSPEIEVTLTGSGIATVAGGPGSDRFRYQAAGGVGGVGGLNLDPGPEDRDLDVTFLGRSQNLLPIYAEGGTGADTIEVVGRPLLAVVADGEEGDDTLRATGAAAAVLEGGPGRDRIAGSPRRDILSPGPGRDTVSGLGGDDFVEISPDREPDTIGCGAGRDATGRPDPSDRLSSCERVERGPRL
jgi:hypothetical protein